MSAYAELRMLDEALDEAIANGDTATADGLRQDIRAVLDWIRSDSGEEEETEAEDHLDEGGEEDAA